MIKVLLIHNKFSWIYPLTWFSLLIRIFTSSKWNHVAIQYGDNIIESKGDGVTISKYEDWEKHANRIVLPMIPRADVKLNLDEVLKCEGIPYGFLDVWERFKRIVNLKWFGKESYNLKDYKGLVCSDLFDILLGIPKLDLPSDIEFNLNLTKEEEYITYKK